MSIDIHYIVKCRAPIAEIAQGMLDGRISYIEGSRRICGLLDGARLDRFESPVVKFVAIDSETDGVPIGEVRANWHPDAKIRFAHEWANAEQYAKTVAEAACRQAIEWLAQHPPHSP